MLTSRCSADFGCFANFECFSDFIMSKLAELDVSGLVDFLLKEEIGHHIISCLEGIVFCFVL